ncbi:hypothetical protein C8R43DRAFT_1053100 [Mycena crocata]|nr:hypothetical protein C8R43DRAFT_1053100 [Mycena crocata]
MSPHEQPGADPIVYPASRDFGAQRLFGRTAPSALYDVNGGRSESRAPAANTLLSTRSTENSLPGESRHSASHKKAMAPSKFSGVVSIGLLALDTLLCISVPPAAGPDLWPRAWAWIQFADTYHEHLSGLEDVPPTKNILTYLTVCIEPFEAHPETVAMTNSTKGFRPMLVRAWASLLDDWDHPEANRRHLLTVMGKNCVSNRSWRLTELSFGLLRTTLLTYPCAPPSANTYAIFCCIMS